MKAIFLERSTELSRRLAFVLTLLMGITVAFVLYELFFLFSAQIWDCYKRIDPLTLTPSLRQWVYEHDGIEAYVLYLFALCGMGGAAFLTSSRALQGRGQLTIKPLNGLFYLVATMVFFISIGLNFPMPAKAHGLSLWLACTEVLILLYLLYKISCLSKLWSTVLVMVLLAPLCFIATKPISLLDYSFIFSPAYRLIHHAKLENIYFQYDLFMPLLAAGWMKLGLDANDFQIIPRLSIYLFCIGLFVYARRYFSKPLPYVLLAALIIIKIYAIPNGDLAASIQITPLRLDLWLLLLFIVAEKGVYSKWLGCGLGGMAIIHHNFGIFYILSYLELSAALFLIDHADHVHTKSMTFIALIRKHFILTLPNLVLIGCGLLTYNFLFHSTVSEGIEIYKTLGVGFLRVSNVSFYWYVLALQCVTIGLLLQNRKNFSTNYLASGLFLLFIVTANSLYFFGRSHEWNLLNISASIVLTFFLFLDILYKTYLDSNPQSVDFRLKQRLLRAAPSVFVLVMGIVYSERIVTSTQLQITNLMQGKFQYPMSAKDIDANNLSHQQLGEKIFNIDSLKSITHGSNKVYILSYLPMQFTDLTTTYSV